MVQPVAENISFFGDTEICMCLTPRTFQDLKFMPGYDKLILPSPALCITTTVTKVKIECSELKKCGKPTGLGFPADTGKFLSRRHMEATTYRRHCYVAEPQRRHFRCCRLRRCRRVAADAGQMA